MVAITNQFFLSQDSYSNVRYGYFNILITPIVMMDVFDEVVVGFIVRTVVKNVSAVSILVIDVGVFLPI